MDYIPRIIEKKLAIKLRTKGAVLIEGAKWCGKTTTASHMSNSAVMLANARDSKRLLELAQLDPIRLLEGPAPRLIDEWQLAPEIWDAVRGEIDQRNSFGQFILTGSAVPPSSEQIKHTGTGRYSWLTMRTMSLYESGDSSGEVSLRELFYNSADSIRGSNLKSLNEIAWLCCRGGWPMVMSLEGEDALEPAFDYVDAVIKTDIKKAGGKVRSVERTRLLMRSLAKNQGSQTSIANLRKDMLPNDTTSLDEETVAKYLNLLKNIFVVEDMAAWNPNLRSKTAIRTTDTRYFVDPSIATATLGWGPDDLLNDLKTFGFIFECMAVRDLRVYAESLNGSVYHYRDSNGLECDAVIHLRDGRYGLVEVKLGSESGIQEGADNLNKLKSIIDTEKMKAPSFSMILTAVGEYAYRRADGILIVPISTLRD